MSPERYHQIRNVFETTLAQPAETRPAFLDQACENDPDLRHEVERLLAAQAQVEGFIEQPALLAQPPGEEQSPPAPIEGRRLGAYALVRELGQGGMGTVYLAQRADEAFHKQVAIKVVRPGLGSREILHRFEQEREILAGLDHPHIARLLDGGSTEDGLPYFVMEYIEGTPIDQYCDQHKLSISERLHLFEQVCAAVEYAHQHLVVHRDLKPGNILVTQEGTVKLLDFGIAKLLRAPGSETTLLETRTGLHVMTPEYASPEQVKGEPITTATDVYALGVVLYELLTGHRPYRLKSRLLHEIARVICEEEPTRPSTVITQSEELDRAGTAAPPVTPQSVSQVRQTTPVGLKWSLLGDLDSVVMKSLQKEPARRYASAETLREDLQRYRQGLPVLARTGLWGAWTSKLVRHTPVGLAIALFLVAARTYLFPALVIGTAIPLVMGVVPPNRWYGVRTPKTFSSLDLWYKANRMVAW
jgi:serine/threonine protein kinase